MTTGGGGPIASDPAAPARPAGAAAPPPPDHPLIVLDGGTGHLLKQWGAALPGLPVEQQFLAGVVANETAPELVRRAHIEYIAAGACCITTNGFVATAHSLAQLGRAGDAAALAARAARLAAEARDAAGVAGVLVAGTLPPLKESYQTEGLYPPDEMRRQYAELTAALAPHVDVLLAETLSTSAEAAAAADAAEATGKPLWVSFTLEDSTAARLRSNEPLAATAPPLAARPHVAALLLNCCAPAAASAGLPALRAAVPARVRVGAYANGFRTTTSEWLAAGASSAPRLELYAADYDPDGLITPAAYTRAARGWRAAGASVVGGCCGVGPAHIRAVAAALADPG